MLDVFRALFYPLPKVGDIYVFDEPKDPWNDKRTRVQVLDVADGWVRFRWLNAILFQDERKKRSTFHFCYVKDKIANENHTNT